MDIRIRDLRREPDEPQAPTTRECFHLTMAMVEDYVEEVTDLADCRRLLSKYAERAEACGAKRRAAALVLAHDFIEEAGHL